MTFEQVEKLSMKFTISTTVEVDVTPAEAIQLGTELMSLAVRHPESPLAQAWLQASSRAYNAALSQSIQEATRVWTPWLLP